MAIRLLLFQETIKKKSRTHAIYEHENTPLHLQIGQQTTRVIISRKNDLLCSFAVCLKGVQANFHIKFHILKLQGTE